MDLDTQIRNWIEEEFETKMEDRLAARLVKRIEDSEHNLIKELKFVVRDLVNAALNEKVVERGTGCRTGESWDMFEEKRLIKNIKRFINREAKRSDRSYRAIIMKLEHLRHADKF